MVSKGTSIETIVRVEGTRWRVEEGFETAKNELGLDHNETRSWHGWHRHVSLVMLDYSMMAAVRYQANSTPKKTKSRIPKNSSVGRSRKFGALLQTRPASDKARPHSCMVHLSTRPSSGSAWLTSQIQNATVVLGGAATKNGINLEKAGSERT